MCALYVVDVHLVLCSITLRVPRVEFKHAATLFKQFIINLVLATSALQSALPDRAILRCPIMKLPSTLLIDYVGQMESYILSTLYTYVAK